MCCGYRPGRARLSGPESIKRPASGVYRDRWSSVMTMPPSAEKPAKKRTTRLLCGHCLGTGRMMADGGAFDVTWRAGDICPTCKGDGVVTIEAALPARPTDPV